MRVRGFKKKMHTIRKQVFLSRVRTAYFCPAIEMENRSVSRRNEKLVHVTHVTLLCETCRVKMRYMRHYNVKLLWKRDAYRAKTWNVSTDPAWMHSRWCSLCHGSLLKPSEAIKWETRLPPEGRILSSFCTEAFWSLSQCYAHDNISHCVNQKHPVPIIPRDPSI